MGTLGNTSKTLYKMKKKRDGNNIFILHFLPPQSGKILPYNPVRLKKLITPSSRPVLHLTMT
jgi:hypothetical protein